MSPPPDAPYYLIYSYNLLIAFILSFDLFLLPSSGSITSDGGQRDGNQVDDGCDGVREGGYPNDLAPNTSSHATKRSQSEGEG